MNISKDLRKLFREYLANERKRSLSYSGGSPMYGYRYGAYRVQGQYEHEVKFPKDIRIYFYEWSDVNKSPRSFFTLESFEYFLKTCGIYMELYQRDIIKNLGTVYASCYTGTKRLNVRSSYTNLSESMKEYDNRHLFNSSIQKPSCVIETNNRMIQNDGSFFG